MDNLNKENFWNDLMKEYPGAVEHFCNWIDAYKKEVEWDKVFGPNVKFHDIPLEMQNGIIARFELEKFNGKPDADYVLCLLPDQVRNLFKDLQNAVDNRSIKLN